MKMLKFGLFAILLAFAFTGCTCGKIEPGHVGVVVPLSGDDKGTLETTTNGWYFYSFNTNVYEFPTFSQSWNWTNEDRRKERIYFMDKTGQPVGADVGIQFHVPPSMVTTLFKTYRQPLDVIRDTILKMEVRNALNLTAKNYSAEDMFGERREEFFKKALDVVRNSIAHKGITVETLYLNGELELPAAIRQTITAKLQATMLAQQKENEKLAVEAEAAKVEAAALGEARARKAEADGRAAAKIAEAQGEAEALLARARAEAEANRLLRESLTGAIYDIRKMEIEAEVQKAYAARWNGSVPTTILPDQVGGFMMDIRGMSLGSKK